MDKARAARDEIAGALKKALRRTRKAPCGLFATPARRRMRIVGWNIRAGGGYRGLALGAQLRRLRPDVAVLCEFRATPPSAALALALAELGLGHQITTADPRAPGVNRLLVASRFPLATDRGAPRAGRAGSLAPRAGRGRAPICAGRHARAEPRNRSQVAIPRLGAERRGELAGRPRGLCRGHELGTTGHRRGIAGLQPAGRRVDRRPRACGLARCVPPRPRLRARLYVVLTQWRQWLPDRSGLREPGPVAATHPSEPHLGARAALRPRRPRHRPRAISPGAHVRRYGALDRRGHATREIVEPTNFRLGPRHGPALPRRAYVSRCVPSGAASHLDPSHRSTWLSPTGS